MEPDLSFRSDAGEVSILRKWLFIALIASIVFHVLLFFVFKSTRLERFGVYQERLLPRAFSVRRVDIDAKLLEEEPAQKPEPKPPKATDQPPEILIPEEKPFEKLLQDVRATPTAPEMVKPLVNEKPRPDTGKLEEMVKQQSETMTDDLAKALDALNKETALDSPGSLTNDLLPVSDLPSAVKSAAIKAAAAGYSDLDELLAQSGSLKAGTAPILMPTDLLFDYDSAQLRPAAILSLQKLGKLIKRNPTTKFIIEGYTDSYGSPDYNLRLSRSRAESVKRWVVQTTGVEPAQVETRGYGSTRLIAPATGSIEEQQINRRVEIVIQAQR